MYKYFYIYIYVYVYNIYRYSMNMSIYTFMYMYTIYTDIYICACIWVWCILIHLIHICVCTCVFMYVCIYVWTGRDWYGTCMRRQRVWRQKIWHDLSTCVKTRGETWFFHMCDMTHSYVWHDSFIREEARIYGFDHLQVSIARECICVFTSSYVSIHVTHSYV
jgi:hypothetical protein